MDRKIMIDGKEVGFRATALTPRLYRHRYGRDIIRDLGRLRDAYSRAAALPPEATDAEREEAQLSALDLEVFENVAYIMARQYDPAIPGDPGEWLDGFSTFSIYEILPSLLELWQLNNATTSKAKKIAATTREPTGAAFMLRCAELGLARDDLDDMTMGMVYDMVIERGNDREKYPRMATQEDFDRF